MNSRVGFGRVRHRRFRPVEHEFTYGVAMLYLDLDELPELFDDRRLWSARRPALAWFRREDHLGDPAVPLDVAVRDLVEARAGVRPDGPIRLLTHLRYAGWVMNPVSFYWCFDAAGAEVVAVVAEITNTPWGERHCYVLPAADAERRGRRMRFRFPKDFHVSPFMGMAQDYDWRFVVPGDRLAVHMETREGGRRMLDATLGLSLVPVTGRSLARVLVRYPLLTARVTAAIYWQAFRLWRKGAPFFPHPRRRAVPAQEVS